MANADQIRLVLEERAGALHWAMLRHAVLKTSFRAENALDVLEEAGLEVTIRLSTARDHAKRLADRGVLERTHTPRLTYIASNDGRLIYNHLAPILEGMVEAQAGSRVLAVVARGPVQELALATAPSTLEAELLSVLWSHLDEVTN